MSLSGISPARIDRAIDRAIADRRIVGAVVLVAQGEGKADAIAGLVEGPVSAMCPGSVLQLHRTVTVVIDEAAAAKLTLRDYYAHTYAHKPAWQHI